MLVTLIYSTSWNLYRAYYLSMSDASKRSRRKWERNSYSLSQSIHQNCEQTRSKSINDRSNIFCLNNLLMQTFTSIRATKIKILFFVTLVRSRFLTEKRLRILTRLIWNTHLNVFDWKNIMRNSWSWESMLANNVLRSSRTIRNFISTLRNIIKRNLSSSQ